jgi:hypothetical protein
VIGRSGDRAGLDPKSRSPDYQIARSDHGLNLPPLMRRVSRKRPSVISKTTEAPSYRRIAMTTTAMRLDSKWMKTFMFGVSVAAMACLSASAGPAGAQAESKVSWSVNLHLRSVDDIPKRLREPEGSTRLVLAKGKASLKVGNCEEYLNAVSAGFHPATNYDNQMSAEFVHDCFVLRDLQHARAPTASGGSYRLTENSLTQLPPMLVRGAREVTDAAGQAEKRGESWKQFDPTLKVGRIDVDSLMAEDKNTVYFLTIRAHGDFTGDGVEQIAVFGSANGKRSSWSHAEYLILAPTSHGTLVRLTDRRAPYRMKAQIPD